MNKAVIIKAFKDEKSRIAVSNVMSDVTKRTTGECLNITKSVTPHGVILLNESSITDEQWEEIAVKCTNLMTWEYVQ